MLRKELASIESSDTKGKDDVISRIKTIESVLGLEKRLKTDAVSSTVAEMDMKPLDANAFDIQNVLFDYCGVNLAGKEAEEAVSHQKRIERMFSKIRKLPKKSCLL